MVIKLRMTGKQHAIIKSHVLAEDGNEAGSLLICEPVFRNGTTILLVKHIVNVPYEACNTRTPSYLSWPTEEYLLPLYERLEKFGMSLIMLHSHPNGYSEFSETDDENDLKILSRLISCIEGQQPHGSAIMLSDGAIKARLMNDAEEFLTIDMISVAGDDIHYFVDNTVSANESDLFKKTEQVFGSGTTSIMQNLKAGVIGVSGTGSPTAELLLRYHIGELIPIDFDVIENGNLNRMLMSRSCDAENGTLKVDRCAEWIHDSGLPTKVTPINGRVPSEITTEALAECDVIFGCVDNVASRHALNKIACAYLIPYFDLGVAVKADIKNPRDIRQAISRCHYLQPDKSCLLDRGAYSSEKLSDENYRRDNPEFYKMLKKLGYTGERNDIQAVMTLTMEAAVMATDDFMARLRGYRVEANTEFDEQERSFTHGYYEHKAHSNENIALRIFLATGDKHKRF